MGKTIWKHGIEARDIDVFFVGTPAKIGICTVLALTNQKWDTMGIKQGYRGDQYLYMWFCPKSGQLSLKYCIFSMRKMMINHGIFMGRLFFCSDQPICLSWNM